MKLKLIKSNDKGLQKYLLVFTEDIESYDLLFTGQCEMATKELIARELSVKYNDVVITGGGMFMCNGDSVCMEVQDTKLTYKGNMTNVTYEVPTSIVKKEITEFIQWLREAKKSLTESETVEFEV